MGGVGRGGEWREGVYSAARHGEIVLTGERGRIGERGDGEEEEEVVGGGGGGGGVGGDEEGEE